MKYQYNIMKIDLSKLLSIASHSDMTNKHSAVLIYNGRPIVWAYNNMNGGKSYHAEVSVVKKFLRIKGCVLWGYKE